MSDVMEFTVEHGRFPSGKRTASGEIWRAKSASEIVFWLWGAASRCVRRA
jgi:hypothetical protein